VVKVIGQMNGQIESTRVRGKWVTLLVRKYAKTLSKSLVEKTRRDM